jgi:hypothetical protein
MIRNKNPTPTLIFDKKYKLLSTQYLKILEDLTNTKMLIAREEYYNLSEELRNISFEIATREQRKKLELKGKHIKLKSLMETREKLMSESDYIDFGDFAREELGTTCQYGAHFIHGLGGHPRLCGDLRMYNPIPGAYHTIKIHRDDAPELKKRVEAWRENRGTTIFPGYCRSCLHRNRHYESNWIFPEYCTKKKDYISHSDINLMKVCSGYEDYELQTKPRENDE